MQTSHSVEIQINPSLHSSFSAAPKTNRTSFSFKAGAMLLTAVGTYGVARAAGLFPFSTADTVDEAPNTFSFSFSPEAFVGNTVRRLLQSNTPIPDQIIPIGKPYNRDLSTDFPDDYFMVQATSLPNWLEFQYNTFPLYTGVSDRVNDIVISGSIAFVAYLNQGLKILNISDPNNPQVLSSYPVSTGNAKAITLSGNTLFLSTGTGGLQILDVSNVTDPRLLSRYQISSGSVNAAAVLDDKLFVASGTAGLKSFNISDLTNPVLLGNYSSNGTVNDVVVANDILFLASGLVGLEIVNASVLTALTFLSAYRVAGGFATQLVLLDDIVFMTASAENLVILNVSNANNATLLSTYRSATASSAGVAVAEKTVLLANTLGGLEIFDSSDPANLVPLSPYRATFGSVNCVSFANNRIFLGEGSTGFQILNLRQASISGTPLASNSVVGQQFSVTITPRRTDGSSISDTFTLTLNDPPRLVTQALTDQSVSPGQSLQLFPDSEKLFSAPPNTFLVLFLHLINSGVLPAWAALELNPTLVNLIKTDSQGITVANNVAVIAKGNAGLQILDVSNPTAPRELSTYPANGASVKKVTFSGNLLFVPKYNGGVQILNMSNASSPQFLGSYQSGSIFAESIAVVGNTAFVANNVAGLLVLDITDPTNPQLLASFPLPGSGIARGIAAFNNSVFLANGVEGLQIIDVSNKTQPKVISTYPAGDGNVNSVALSADGKTAFVTNQLELQVIDVSDAAHPVLLSHYPADNNGYTDAVSVRGNTVLVPNGGGGLQIFDARNLTNLVLLGSSVGSNSVFTAAMVGDTVLAGDHNNNLEVLRLNTWKMRFQPNTTDAANHHFELEAIDPLDATISIPFTVRVEGAPELNSPITTVPNGKVGYNFYYSVPIDTFLDRNQDHLIYTLVCIGQPSCSPWLTFNPVAVTLAGLPTANDLGTTPLRLTVTDPLGGTASTDFNITVIHVPSVNNPITQPVVCIQNHDCTYHVPENTFESHGYNLSYSVTLNGGAAIPNWLQFFSQNRTLSGLPTFANTLLLSINAQSVFGDIISTPLNLIVNPSFPPQVNQFISTQTATARQSFKFVVPLDTISSPDGDPLDFSVILLGEEEWPEWLKFDPHARTFFGTPGGRDTGTDTNPLAVRVLNIMLTATDPLSKASVSTQFTINVAGNSDLALLIKIGSPLASVLLTLAIYIYMRIQTAKNRKSFPFANALRDELNLEYRDFTDIEGEVYRAKAFALLERINSEDREFYTLTEEQQSSLAVCTAEVLRRIDESVDEKIILPSSCFTSAKSFFTYGSPDWPSRPFKFDIKAFSAKIPQIAREVVTEWNNCEGEFEAPIEDVASAQNFSAAMSDIPEEKEVLVERKNVNTRLMHWKYEAPASATQKAKIKAKAFSSYSHQKSVSCYSAVVERLCRRGANADLRETKKHEMEVSSLETELAVAESKNKIGPRQIAGWELEDVPAKGNCFYEAVVHQLGLLKHSFLDGVPDGTLARDSLRLHIQGKDFKDGEWAGQDEILQLIRKFDCVVAIVDTRYPDQHFVYHHEEGTTPDLASLPQGKPIMQLAFTGNHYLSVKQAPMKVQTPLIASVTGVTFLSGVPKEEKEEGGLTYASDNSIDASVSV